MKTQTVIIVGGASIIGVIAYLYFNKKNQGTKTSPIDATAKSAESLFLPESPVIKASEVVIPKTAVVLPTVALVVQSSVIQEEDINSLDCASLMLKYNAVKKQFEQISTTEGSSSNAQLLKNRMALIENVMTNKNCVIIDPVLVSAIIEQKIIAPTKYTNAEIAQIANTRIEELGDKLKDNSVGGSISSSTQRSKYNATNYDYISKRKYSLIEKLQDFLKTLTDKKDVDSFMLIYNRLIKIIIHGKSAIRTGDLVGKAEFTTTENEFLKRIGYNNSFIS
jgi:hypothetical protein